MLNARPFAQRKQMNSCVSGIHVIKYQNKSFLSVLSKLLPWEQMIYSNLQWSWDPDGQFGPLWPVQKNFSLQLQFHCDGEKQQFRIFSQMATWHNSHWRGGGCITPRTGVLSLQMHLWPSCSMCGAENLFQPLCCLPFTSQLPPRWPLTWDRRRLLPKSQIGLCIPQDYIKIFWLFLLFGDLIWLLASFQSLHSV